MKRSSSPPQRLLTALIVVAALVAAGLTLYRQTLSGPLLSAVKRQDADAVAGLLRRGASPDAVDEQGRSALTLALDPDPYSAGAAYGIGTVFTPGGFHGLPEPRERIALSLLSSGADPKRTPLGTSNLYLALDALSLPVVKALLAHGADPNGLYSDSPLLMWAVMDDAQLYATGREEAPVYTQALLTAGADALVHHTFPRTKTPITVDPLGSSGIFSEELPLIVAVRHTGNREFFALFSYQRMGSAALIDTLLAHGAVIDARDHDGHTALFIAAAQGDPEDVRFLLARGADPAIGDPRGRTPLQAAREAGAERLARARAYNAGARRMPVPSRPLGELMRRSDAANRKMNDESDIQARYGAVEKLLLGVETHHKPLT